MRDIEKYAAAGRKKAVGTGYNLTVCELTNLRQMMIEKYAYDGGMSAFIMAFHLGVEAGARIAKKAAAKKGAKA